MSESDHNPLPYENIVDLARLTEAGSEFAIILDEDTRARIAEWAGIEELERFDATVELKRQSRTRFAYSAKFDADVVQACVVTLEPVKSHIAQHFARALHLLTGVMRGAQDFAIDSGGPLAAGAGEDDAPEQITDTHYDIAAPLLEEFALALDPYPRAPGVEFTPPEEEADPEENPFAILSKLNLEKPRAN
jgi:uncharacterized metal-binding protein YceD (DUF177 family)